MGHVAGAKASLPGQCCEGQCPWLALAGAWEIQPGVLEDEEGSPAEQRGWIVLFSFSSCFKENTE